MTTATHFTATLSQTGGNLLILACVGGIPLWGLWKREPVFEQFVSGAQEGFQMAVRIIPYLVAFMVAIGMFRAAGGFELLAHATQPVLQQLGIPSDLLPLALIRPFSGGASQAMLSDLAQQHGGASLISAMGATLLGSTETTLYVVMVYFAAANITRTRHAIACGLMADAVGVLVACWVVSWLLG